MKKNLIKILAAIGLVSSVLTMPLLTLAALPKVDFSVVMFDETKKKLMTEVLPSAGDQITFRIAINSSSTVSYSNVKIKISTDSSFLSLKDSSLSTGYLVGDIAANSAQKTLNFGATFKKVGDFKADVTVTADGAEPNSQTVNFGGNNGGSCEIDGFNTTDSKLCNPLPDKNLGELVYRLIQYILIGISSMAIVTVVISAFIIVSSQGNEEAIKGAKTSISWAVVGIVLALLAYSFAAIIETAVTR